MQSTVYKQSTYWFRFKASCNGAGHIGLCLTLGKGTVVC